MGGNGGNMEKAVKDLEGKYLTFRLANEEYGLEITKVREIIGLHDITFVPQTESYIKGVVNLRGKVVPVMDLRSRFGLPEEEYHERTCIIVVEVLMQDGERDMVGVVVDSVSEVVQVESDQIQERPPLDSGSETDYIMGIARTEDRVRLLLDVERVLGED